MTTDRKFIACDPADLEAVLNKAEDWTVRGSTVVDALARLRADLARAFTVEDVRAEWEQAWDHRPAYWALLLARRLSPPVEHKVTLEVGNEDGDLGVLCTCGWGGPLSAPDPVLAGNLAREHLAEQGEDR